MIAIYARQSVDKKDSLSIETQIEECKNKLTKSEESGAEIFADRGFSGKNTERPAFQQMLGLIKDGSVKKVVVYKLDRISRSILDFTNMFAEFEMHGAEFISCSENFDTSTPMGKAMLFIIAVFAEMERQTIQKRITDNYYARGEKGFYLGGYAPFGFNKIDFVIDNKKTYCFEENEHESNVVRSIYEQYAYENKNLGEIARWLNANDIKKRRKTQWESSTISRILSNTVYVMADSHVYTFLKAKGATINNPVDDFIGENGCYTYGKVSERKGGSKYKNYNTDFVTIAPHKGIITSETWLLVQERFERVTGHTNIGSGSLSWLQGLVKCICGYSMYVKKSNNKRQKSVYVYFFCKGKRWNCCEADRRMFRCDKLETEVEKLIFEKLENLRNIEANYTQEINPKINSLNIERKKAYERIENLITHYN
jgi:DNA invertase Pin-like site-specific DNA recombinase